MKINLSYQLFNYFAMWPTMQKKCPNCYYCSYKVVSIGAGYTPQLIRTVPRLTEHSCFQQTSLLPNARSVDLLII
jgi:hypothetical protein